MHPISRRILTWYRRHGRRLPWRETRDPYAILTSEVMLQQTQVDRVIPRYEVWLARWPDFAALASASRAQVLAAWSGLGYNNRAVRLHRLAQEVVERLDGILPETEQELVRLPGIGAYTARAVLAFAHNKAVPLIDTNIRRVLICELHLDESISMRELEAHALALIPRGRSCEWHNALMDYGALELTARRTGVRPTSHQGRFEGSERQLRGKVVKLLLGRGRMRIDEVARELGDDRLDRAIASLRRDGVLELRDGELRIG